MTDRKEVFALGPDGDEDDVWLTEYADTGAAVLRAGSGRTSGMPRGGSYITPERARSLAAKLVAWADSKEGGATDTMA